MDELIKLRIKNLISLRQSLLMLLPILVGGVIGLFFMKENFLLRNILIGVGFFFFFILLTSLHGTIAEINRTLYKNNKRRG